MSHAAHRDCSAAGQEATQCSGVALRETLEQIANMASCMSTVALAGIESRNAIGADGLGDILHVLHRAFLDIAALADAR